MRKFSERWNADWLTPTSLEELLIEFFEEDSEPKSLTHLHCWLNQDQVTIEKRKCINDTYRRLLEAAEMMCEEWAVSHGFNNDKSFAKWYLQTYHPNDDNNNISGEEVSKVEISFVTDTK